MGPPRGRSGGFRGRGDGGGRGRGGGRFGGRGSAMKVRGGGRGGRGFGGRGRGGGGGGRGGGTKGGSKVVIEPHRHDSMKVCSFLRVKTILFLLRIWSLVNLSTTRNGSLSRSIFYL